MGRVKRDDGELTKDDEETAEQMCRYFAEVYKKGDCQFNTEELNDAGFQVKITEKDVNAVLKHLKKDKSQGPDEIHPMLLREAADELTSPLTKLFNQTMKEGHIPQDWKRANITPIHKKGRKDEAENYRPISLTSVVCKVIEQVMKKQITDFLEGKGFYSKHQHGFRTGRSCLTNLLETFESWTQYLDEGYGVDVVYLDYRKAFDSVPHEGLIEKLKTAGFGPELVGWVESYLEGRTMRVVINGKVSRWRKIESGVPQGAVLAPLLFLIYVNELPDWMKSEIKLFADDSKLWHVIRDDSDAELL